MIRALGSARQVLWFVAARRPVRLIKTMSSDSSAVPPGLWLPPDQDPRTSTSPATELQNYRTYLDRYRLTLELKAQDLSPRQLATRSVPPSNLSLLGLVRHMAAVEHSWFQRCFRGHWDQPRLYRTEEDRDLDFNGAVGAQECVDDALTSWKREIAAADAWLDTQTDATMGTVLPFENPTQSASVRDILLHLIQEYARHCGHADLLRENIDGRTGV